MYINQITNNIASLYEKNSIELETVISHITTHAKASKFK